MINKYPEMFSAVKSVNIDAPRIIYPNMIDYNSTKSQSECDPTNDPQVADRIGAVKYVPNDLLLPWNEPHWNVYVTSPISTVEVWARIIGPEYSVSDRIQLLPFLRFAANFECVINRGKWTRC